LLPGVALGGQQATGAQQAGFHGIGGASRLRSVGNLQPQREQRRGGQGRALLAAVQVAVNVIALAHIPQLRVDGRAA